MAEQEKKESFAKRDELRRIELEVQREWEEKKVFETNAPADLSKPKYMGTFPYPYMNGRLHLGHTFTLTKVEFTTAYQRLKGREVLFPFAFHCTGMPIKACADKLKREMELYGNPPVFPVPVPEPEEAAKPADAAPAAKADPTQFHAQKSKVKSKSAGVQYQWQIMRSMGVPEQEIHKFADAEYWLQYFPPYCQEDMRQLGVGVDWRRSFITTDVNPYYDSFVRWHFETLRERGKLQFGKRYSIYSPKDGQPCADHDRQTGEGVLPQEYTLIKLEVVAEPELPAALKPLSGRRVYLVPGTLRPETMYGQTNVWVLPEGQYGAFEINDTDVFICSERSARNLSFQGFSKVHGQTSCLLKVTGQELLGMKVKAPLSVYGTVYVLPMLSISMTKGTGIVTSVPSDAPDDYIWLEEYKKKQPFRAKYGIADEMVLPFDVVPIIDVPGLGTSAAATTCASLKIKSPNDRVLLDQAKDAVYKKGFYEGVMLVGDHKGRTVQDAKPLIRDHLISTGQAVVYSEPAEQVTSRSGDECVVCLTDQWFIDYGEPVWRAQVEEHLKSMDFYSEDTTKKFEIALGWLNQWACSRTYGLGTRLPWDQQYLIDSLSDSTIYMAYYTVAHLLQGGAVDGSKVGPAGIRAEQLTKPVWDYIFLNGAYPEGCGIQESTLQGLRREFDYWYPVDLRVSGKDLITNHLTFFLYNHIAIFPKEKWPRTIRANGHTLLDNEKMSKSTGNFLTLIDGIHQYSADGMRFALADAGDTLDDANFATKTTSTAILRLHTQLAWTKEVLGLATSEKPEGKKSEKDELRDGPADAFFDRVFASQMAKLVAETDHHYSRTNFQRALKTGFFDFQAARDAYRANCITAGVKMNRELIMRFIEYQTILLAPITPHLCEHIWGKLLGKSGSVCWASWPTVEAPDQDLLDKASYVQSALHAFRIKRETMLKPRKGAKPTEPIAPPTKATISVAKSYPQWMERSLTAIRPLFEKVDRLAEPLALPSEKEITAVLAGDAELKKFMKKAMPFIVSVKEAFLESGLSAFDLQLKFDEKAFLDEFHAFIQSALGLTSLDITYSDDATGDSARPSKPFIMFSA